MGGNMSIQSTILRAVFLLAVCLAPECHAAGEGLPPERVKVLPVFLVPQGERPPGQARRDLLMRLAGDGPSMAGSTPGAASSSHPRLR